MKEKKKFIIVGIVILSIIVMYFVISNVNTEMELVEEEILENVTMTKILENVTMTIKEGTLTKTGATVIITDISGDDNTYGEFFRIDKKENNKWKKVDVVVKGNYGFHMVGYEVNEDNILEMKIDWNWLYGELDTGEYRLVKSASVSKNNSYLGEKYIYVEFSIE